MFPVESAESERHFADDALLHRACELSARDRQQPVIHLPDRTGPVCESIRIAIRVRTLQVGRGELDRARPGHALVPLPRLARVHGKAGGDDHRHHITRFSHPELPRDIAVERRGVSGVMRVGDGVPQPFPRAVAQLLHPETAERQPAPPGRAGHIATAEKVHVEQEPPVTVVVRAGQLAGTVRIGYRVVDERFLGHRERDAGALRLAPVRGDPGIESGEGESAAEQQHRREHCEQHGAALSPPSGRGISAPDSHSTHEHAGSMDARRALVCRTPARARGDMG